MADNKIITQSAVPTNNHLVNKGYVSAQLNPNITPFDSKILMFSIISD